MQLAKDRRIPYYFIAFFVVLALVDGVMVTLAVRTHTGTVMAHPYETGLAYNTLIAASEAQEKLGWEGALTFEQQSPKQGKIVFSLQDAKGKPVDAERVTLVMKRPTQDGYDATHALNHIGGRYSRNLTFPLPGLWEIRVYAEAQGRYFQQAKRIVVE